MTVNTHDEALRMDNILGETKVQIKLRGTKSRDLKNISDRGENIEMIQNTKVEGQRLQLTDSVFSMYYISLMNFDKMDLEAEGCNQLVDKRWLQINNLELETV